MLTDTQAKTFKDLQDGKLNPKQKADFYFRMSNILKEKLEETRDSVYLLNEIPDSYLAKIDFTEAAIGAMKLSEAILKKRGLPCVLPTYERNNLQAVKSYDLGPDNLKLPTYEGKEMAFSIVGISVICDLTEDESKIINHVLEHIHSLKAALMPTREKISGNEFDTQILPQIFSDAEKKGVKCSKQWEYVEQPKSLEILLETAANMTERDRIERTFPNLKANIKEVLEK